MKGRLPAQFASVILEHSVARNNRFDVEITLPKAVEKAINQSDEGDGLSGFINKASKAIKKVTSVAQKILGTGNPIDRTISVMVESVQFPGRSFATSEHNNNRPTRKLPHTALYEDVTMTFLVSEDMWEKLVIDEWMNSIYDAETNSFEYLENYASTIKIKQLDTRHDMTHSIVLKDAYPVTISALESSRSNQNDYHRLQVTFTYHYWIYDTEEEGIPDPFEDPAGFAEAMLDNGIANKAYDLITTGEADFTGEGLAVYNKVSTITKEYAGVSPAKAKTMLNKVDADLKLNDKIDSAQKANLSGKIRDVTNVLL